MTPKLTISQLLKKHFPTGSQYGQGKAASVQLGCSQKQFSRWYSGATQPNSGATIEILRRINELRNYKP